MEFRILGPIEVWDDRHQVAIGAGKQRALLAALLIEANTVVSIDRLVDALWGERPPPTAAKNVQVLVSALRKALAAAGDPGCISTAGSGYMLRVAPDATDASRFDALLEAGRTSLAEGRPREAERALAKALSIWRGRAYEDVAYDDFAREEIARLEARRVDAFEVWYEAMLAGRRHAEAVTGLQKLAAEHPLREQVIALRMLALHRCGRRAEALAVYDEARRRLADDLGVEPGQRLQELYRAVLTAADEDGDGIDELAAPARRSPARLLLAAAALLVAVAAATALVVVREHGSVALRAIPGDEVGLINPRSGVAMAAFPVGRTPTDVVARGQDAWIVNRDSQTVSRVDRDGTTVPGVAVHGDPLGVAWADGSVWVLSSTPHSDTFRFVLTRLDPMTMRDEAHVRLPSGGLDASVVEPIAAAAGKLWVGVPYGKLTEIQPHTGKILRSIPIEYQGQPSAVRALAADGDTLWVLHAEGEVQPFDGRSGQPRGSAIRVFTPHVTDVAAGNGLVWVSDLYTGDVYRIDPGPPAVVDTVAVGGSAGKLALAEGSVWVVDGVEGNVARIDPRTKAVERTPIGNIPIGIASSTAGVWASVAGQTTATGTCGRPIYGGTGHPDLLLAADEPLDRPDAAFATKAMVAAMRHELRAHGFLAGRFRVGLQLCDDSTSADAPWGGSMAPKCSANALLYARTPAVVAVIGPFFSGCTAMELPILNRAPSGPLAMISPANDWAGFTSHVTGTGANEPAGHYPTGRRSYLRVYPSDAAEASADARLARSLGVRRIAVPLAPGADTWDTSMAYSFARAAQSDGIAVIGPGVIARAGLRALVREGGGGVFVGGHPSDALASVIREARRVGGAAFPIIAPNFWFPGVGMLGYVGRAARGVYLSVGYYTDPGTQIPPAGAHHATDGFAPYAAQAVDVALAAIAHSDGTRRSVLGQLFRGRVQDGILGTFGFGRNGDMTTVPVPIYRVEPNAPLGMRPYRILSVSGD